MNYEFKKNPPPPTPHKKIMVFKRNNKSLEYPGFSIEIYTPQPCL